MVGTFQVYTLTALENSEEMKKRIKTFFQNAAHISSSSTSTIRSVESSLSLLV